MKSTNVPENNQLSLKEKFLRSTGDKLAQMAVGPRCFGIAIYEPELSPGIIKEMQDEQ